MHPLLAAILAAPEGDLAPHAVYADALLAHGDPRGELIAIELALAKAPDRPELAARRAWLRTTHGEAWWPGIPTAHVRTRHGFVDAIAIPAEDIDRAVALAAREPLRSLELRGPVPPEVIARVPPVETLVAHELTEAALQALGDAPCATTLQTLDISGSHDVIAFAAGRALPSLRALSIAATWIEAESLAAWAHAGTLRALDISLPRDRTFDTHVVLRAAPRLETLRASCVDDFPTAETLAALAATTSLVRLESYGNLDASEALRVRAALPARAELAAKAPARVALDLLGTQVAFTQAGEAYRDGVRLPLHIRFIESYAIAYGTKILLDDPVPTGLLVDAIACGGPRILTETGCTIAAALLPWDHRVTAMLEVGDARVDLELDYYVD